MSKATIQMTPGDDTHLTLLMAPQSLNFVTGQDREHLLAFGRAAFEAGQATKCLLHIAEPASRFCPECGHVGDVGANHRDCCPDGSSAFTVPAKWANELRAGFKAQLAATPHAVQPAVPVAHLHKLTDGHRTLKQDVFSAIHDYSATKPEQDPDDPESWESWFVAAFDLLGTRVGQIFEEHAERDAAAPAHPAEGVPAAQNDLALSRACDLLSMTVITMTGFRETAGYTDNSPIAGLVSDAVEFLLPWPEKLPNTTQPAAQGLDAQGWLPIETAPKDGSWIRLWREPSQEDWWFAEPETTARWCSERLIWTWPDDDYEVFTQYGRDKAEALIEGDNVYTSDEFTHWMRLPSMPALAAQAKQGGA